MTDIQLFDRDGKMITTARVPKNAPADIIEFDGRRFILKAGRYVEANRTDIAVATPAA